MTPLGNLVVLWGGGLLLANLLFDPTFATLRGNIISGQAGAADLDTSPVHMILVGLLTLLVVSFLANTNPRWAKAILAALAGLTVLWLISYTGMKSSANAGTPTPAPAGNSPGAKVATPTPQTSNPYANQTAATTPGSPQTGGSSGHPTTIATSSKSGYHIIGQPVVAKQQYPYTNILNL